MNGLQPDQTALEKRAKILGDFGILVTVAILELDRRYEAFSRSAFRQHAVGALDIHETGKAPHVLAFDMSEPHRPIAEIALRDLSLHQRGELRVARITLDLFEESHHGILGPFENLQKGVSVKQEHPGHVLEMIVDLRLDKQFAYFAQCHGTGRLADINDLMQHFCGRHFCSFLCAFGLEEYIASISATADSTTF